VFLQSNEAKASTARIAASLEPKASPVASLLYRTNLDGSEPGAHPTLTAGVVVRGPLSSGITMNLASGARLMGSVAAVDMVFSADSSLYYDPLSVETGVSLEYLPGARVIAQLDTQLWSKFEAPALIIANPQSTCTNTDESDCGLQVSGGVAPEFHAADIVIVRLAHEWQATDRLSLRLGYAHRPSIFDGLPEGAGNYLDPAREIFTGGLGYQLSSFFGAEVPARIDFHLAYHALETQHIVKESGDELGAGTGDLKIGAPGYDAGGNIIGGGLSLSFAL
jgi:hypothetical protein